jgi:hypothetical protein
MLLHEKQYRRIKAFTKPTPRVRLAKILDEKAFVNTKAPKSLTAAEGSRAFKSGKIPV